MAMTHPQTPTDGGWRLSGLEIAGFRGIADRVQLTPTSGLTLLVGANGTGKSSTLLAIEWCLFGSEIEKKAAGIAERADWLAVHRAGAAAATAGGDAGVPRPEAEPAVTLQFTRAAQRCRLTRRRPAGARRDDLELQLGDGTVMDSAAAVGRWLQAADFPDWATYKRAFAQHQELARGRLLDQAGRSDQLAALLGLAPAQALRSELERQGKLAQQTRRAVEQQLRELAADLMQSTTPTNRRATEVADQLLAAGLPRHARSDAAVVAHLTARVAEARQALALCHQEFAPLATFPGATALAPGVATAGAEAGAGAGDEGDNAMAMAGTAPGRHAGAVDLDATLRWFEAWPDALRQRRNGLQEAIDAATARGRRIAGVLESAAPLRQALRRTVQTRDHLEAEHGGLAEVKVILADTERELRRQREQLAQRDRHAALLADTRALLARADDADHCPVCSRPATDLAARVDAALAALRPAEDPLQAAIRGLEARQLKLRKTEQTLLDLDLQIDGARNSLARARQDLRSALGGSDEDSGGARDHDSDDDTSDANDGDSVDALIERAERERARLATQAAALQPGIDALAQLPDFTAERRIANLYLTWRSAIATAPHRRDLQSRPEWQQLAATLDELGGLCADLDALADLARRHEAAQSRARIAEVNASLGGWYARITGRPAEGIAVQEKRTAARLSYRIVDAAGHDLTPVLNQASLNGLSFAMLLAQAADRAATGRPQWLVLDEPAQSLDAAHRAGLAACLQQIAACCPVLVASLPGDFAEQLAATPGGRRIEVTAPHGRPTLTPMRTP